MSSFLPKQLGMQMDFADGSMTICPSAGPRPYLRSYRCSRLVATCVDTYRRAAVPCTTCLSHPQSADTYLHCVL